MRRVPDTGENPGKELLGCGGRVSAFERTGARLTIVGGLAEELGPSLVEVEHPIVTWIRPPDPLRRMDYVFLVGFLCRHRRGEIVLSAEHIEFRWVTKVDCASLDLAPGYVAALEQFWLAASLRPD